MVIDGVSTRGARALAPEVDYFRRQFEQLATDVNAFVTGLSDAEFAWQPEPERWSIAQCIDHLNATARVYLPVLDEGIADAMRGGMPGPHVRWIGRIHVLMAQPTRGFASRHSARSSPCPDARDRRSWRPSAPTRFNTSIGCDRPTDLIWHAPALHRRWCDGYQCRWGRRLRC